MNIKQFKRSDAVRVMNWCKHNVGLNYRRKYLPMLEWHTRADDEGDCGDYDFEENKITIYKQSHISAIDIIHTIIHEWQHYLQSSKKYYDYADKYGYANNPFEKQANYIANKYKYQCKRDLFR